MTILIGKDVGRYHILEQLGEGGMATVYKAYDTRLETDVAVKFIRTERLSPEIADQALKRFEREAKSLARLTHPNIVKVMDYGEFEGQPFLVMPYLPGQTLKQRIGGKPMSSQDACKLIIPIAQALDYAHSLHIIHRDIKPANILLTQTGEPMLSDFGVAKIIEDDATVDLTGTSAAVGTPEYMAPEQITSKTVDHRADIYALGIVLYEMLTGRKPFQADTPMAVLFKQASDPLPSPRQFVNSIPVPMEKILIKALAKKPEDRYQSMGEFAAALKLQNDSGKSSENMKSPTPSRRRIWQTTALILLAVVVVGSLVVVGILQKGKNASLLPGSTDPSIEFIPSQIPSLVATFASVEPKPATKTVGTALIPPSDIPLYDDFSDSGQSAQKWHPPLWGNPGGNVPTIEDGLLKFDIPKDWSDWVVGNPKKVEAFYALLHLGQNTDGVIGITVRNIDSPGMYALMMGPTYVVVWDLAGKEHFSYNIGVLDCCHGDHLLGVKSDGIKLDFYFDNQVVGSYPMKGFPDTATLEINSPQPGTGFADSVWMKFRP
jgi:serine/threonine protein kinase